MKKNHEKIVAFIEAEFQRVPALSTMGLDGIKSHFVDGKSWLKAFEPMEERDFKDSFQEGKIGAQTIQRCLKTIKAAKPS